MVAALAAGPTSAWACNNTKISVSETSAEAGDVVHWTIGDAEPGAEFEVSVEGRVVRPRGPTTEPVPRGSFVMPDFGSAERPIHVYLVASHDHEGGPWPTNDVVTYRPPAAPPAATAPPAEAPQPTAQPELPRERSDSGRAPAADNPDGAEPRARDLEPKTRVSVPKPAETAVPVASPATAAGEPADIVARAEAPSVAAPARAAEPKPDRPVAAPAPLPERLAPQPVAAPANPISVPGRGQGPPVLLVALVLGLGGVVVLAMMLLRRRGGESAPATVTPTPIPPDLMVEAELQEIIAEERLRLLEKEHRRDLAEEGEPVRAGPG